MHQNNFIIKEKWREPCRTKWFNIISPNLQRDIETSYNSIFKEGNHYLVYFLLCRYTLYPPIQINSSDSNPLITITRVLFKISSEIKTNHWNDASTTTYCKWNSTNLFFPFNNWHGWHCITNLWTSKNIDDL